MIHREILMRTYKLFFMFIIFISGTLLIGADNNPRILIETELGDITVEIYANKAPLTAANFLKYVDEHTYDGSCFYRIVTMDNQPDKNIKIEVIQGGILSDPGSTSFEPIPHETTEQTGILHKHGVISMARLEPGTASSEFFICVNDQPELDFGGRRNPDGQGFAAFGKVIQGMDVVLAIHRQPAKTQYLEKKIKIVRMYRIN